jgi:hypothetical protein
VTDVSTPNLGKLVLQKGCSQSKKEFVSETSFGHAAKGIKN